MTPVTQQPEVDGSVLFVGPGGRGGIASVLEVYRTMFIPFNFIKTYIDGGKAAKTVAAACGYAAIAARLFHDRKIRIVHVHSASYASFWRKSVVIRLAKAMGRKVIFHCHSGAFKTFYDANPDKIKKTLLKCDQIIALSEQWRDFFNSIGFSNTEVINNVIPVPQIAPKASSDGKFHVVFLGKITEAKGIYDLIDALRANRERFAGKLVLHVGGNGEVDRFRSLTADPALSDMITYEGWVEGTKKAGLFNQMDALILPSYIEGVPICLLEAMSYGKPVITTPIGGIPSIVTDGHNGLIVQPGDKDGIAAALSKLIDNPSLSTEMGHNGLDVAAAYQPPEVAKSLRKLYTGLLADVPDK